MVNYRSFVRAWMEAHKSNKGLDGVSKKLNIDSQKCSIIATKLRTEMGVNLPAMQRANKNNYSSEELNALIAELS